MLFAVLFYIVEASFEGAFKDMVLSLKTEVFYAASGALFDCNGAYGGKVDLTTGLSMSPD